MISNPTKIVETPDGDLVEAGRCGRWKRDQARTDAGLPTRKQEALAALETAKGEGKTPAQLAALARRLVKKAAESGWRCKITVNPRGSGCKRLHGGKTPSGVDSPQFKHGRYSLARYLRPEQVKAYEAWLNDPARFDHARQGAALEVLLVNQVSRLRAPALVEWKLISDGWAMIQKAGRLASTGKDADKEKAVLLQGQALSMIGQGIGGFDVERDNAEAVKVSADLITEQRRVASAENLRTHREQEIITLQQHTAQRAREIELFWQAIENETRGMKGRDAKLVRGALLAGVAAWRAEGDRWTEGPKGTVN